MKQAHIIALGNLLLLLAGCSRSDQPPAAPAAAPTIQAAPAQQFGHLSPIQLPAGEYFAGFYVQSEVWDGARLVSGGYFFATSRDANIPAYPKNRTHTLRDSGGTPVLIVKD